MTVKLVAVDLPPEGKTASTLMTESVCVSHLRSDTLLDLKTLHFLLASFKTTLIVLLELGRSEVTVCLFHVKTVSKTQQLTFP